MPQGRASLGSSNRQAPSDAEAMQKAPVAVHHRSACSGVKALRNTSVAKRQAAKLWLAFRSLDPFRALREPDRRRRDEERPCRSEQKTATNQNDYLTGKAPYKSYKLDHRLELSLALCTIRICGRTGRAARPMRARATTKAGSPAHARVTMTTMTTGVAAAGMAADMAGSD
jgi:hypothetical protein